MFVHPDQLEREIAQAAKALAEGFVARRLGTWSEHDEGPLKWFRALTTRERFERASELPNELPTFDSLRRWLATLIIERVTWEDRAAAEAARRESEHKLMGLGDRPWSVRALTLELVRTNDPGRRAQAAESLVRVAGDASEAATWWMRRRHAAADHLGLVGLSWLEGPWDGISTQHAAATVLDATEVIASEALPRGVEFQDVLWTGAAMDAREGWPAKLTPRWFRSVFGSWQPLAGLRVDTGPLVQPFCGASFARALARFGAAAYRGCARRNHAPFSLQVRPFDAGPASYGALFGSLLMSVPFLRRRLGLGLSTAREQARAMSASMLISLRMTAARAMLASQRDEDGAMHAHAKHASGALASTVPDELTGVVPRYDPRSASWLAGAIAAARLNHRLVESYDEDWFDNPHAHQDVTAVDVTKRLVLNEEHVVEGARAAVCWLAEGLG